VGSVPTIRVAGESAAAEDAVRRTLQAIRLTGVWQEQQVTWNNQPASAGAAATVASGTGWRVWNTTQQVQDMYAANQLAGFLIRDSVNGGGGNHEQVFHSRENASNQPELTIVYRPAG
jgi:large repetitive protein